MIIALYFIIFSAFSVLFGAFSIATLRVDRAKQYSTLWTIWGNNEDQTPPDWYLPENNSTWVRTFMWYLRNSHHNLFFHVLKVTGERKGAFPDQIWNPNGGWNWATVNNIPAFVSYRGKYIEGYIGWREKGNFGLALRKAYAR